MLAERCQADLIGVCAGEGHRPGEDGLEEPRRVARKHNPLEPLPGDLLGKGLWIQSGKQSEVPDHFHAGQIGGVRLHLAEIDGRRVAPTRLANVHTRPHDPPVTLMVGLVVGGIPLVQTTLSEESW